MASIYYFHPGRTWFMSFVCLNHDKIFNKILYLYLISNQSIEVAEALKVVEIFVKCCQNFEIDFTHPYWAVGSGGYVSSRQCISCKDVCLVFKSAFSSENQPKNPALSDLYPLFVSWGSMNPSEVEEFVQCSCLPSFVKATLEKIQQPRKFFKAFLQKEVVGCLY